MTDADDEFVPPAPRRRRRLLRFAARLAGALAIFALLSFVGRWHVGRLGERQLHVATQKLDAEEPGWRLDALLDERNKHRPPPDQDAAPLVLQLAAGIPHGWTEWHLSLLGTDWPRQHPDNRRPSDASVAAAGKMAEPTRTLRDRAVQLRDKRAGAYPLALAADDPLATALPHLNSARWVVALLAFDAHWETLHGNPNRGIAAARAALGVARSLGDEPLLISQLVRIACAKGAAQIALQTLAWGAPTEGLAALQAELLAEAAVPWLRTGMRGERAMLDRLFAGLEDDTIPWETCFRSANVKPGPEHHAAFRAYKALLPGDRAKCLQVCTGFLEASDRPPHEQHAAVKAVALPGGPPGEYRFLLTRLLIPAFNVITENGLRARAELLAAGIAIACERFRIKHGRLPRALNELVPEFLPALPASPFDAGPPRYRNFDDRVAVFYVWENPPPFTRLMDPDFDDPDAHAEGHGHRLWNPDRRGLPPRKDENPAP